MRDVGFRRVAFACIFWSLTGGANAQTGEETDNESANRQPFRIETFTGLSATYTDNVSPTAASKESDWILKLQPGVRMQLQSSRASGSLDVGVDHYMYVSDSGKNHTETPLSGTGKVELVENWLFVDASATIATQTRSLFGTQAGNDELRAGNRVRTRTVQLAPRISGAFSGNVDYEMRVAQVWASSNEGALARGSGARTTQVAGKVSGDTGLSWVGWSVLAEDQRASLQGIQDTKNGRVLANATVRVDPQFRVELSAGHEYDNFNIQDRRSRTVAGIGTEWAPTERTKVSYRMDSRSFGNSRSFDFTHRTALTAWSFQTGKGVRLPTQSFAGINGRTAFEVLAAQLVGTISDPTQRAEEARRRLDLAGIPLNASVAGSFLSTDPYLESRTSGSVAWTGAQNSILLGGTRAKSQRLSTLTPVFDDFALSPTIWQSGLNANWTYAFDPSSSVSLASQSSKSHGDAGLASEIKTLTLSYRTKIGERTSAGVALRSVASESTTGTSYDENAIVGSVRIDF